MDSAINPDLIAFVSTLALAVNAAGALIFAVVMRRLWVATAPRDAVVSRTAPMLQAARAGRPCPAL